MKIILSIFLTVLVCCSVNKSLTIAKIPTNWVHLTMTDSGFVHLTHQDMGSTMLAILNSKTVQLTSDQSVIVFNIEKLDSTASNSFVYTGVYTFGARLKGDAPQLGKMKFSWIDQKKELGIWTIEFKGKIIIEENFSSIRKIKEYPTIKND